MEGVEVLGLIERCQGQIRTAGLGQIIGLDYGAVLRLAEGLGLNMTTIAALLPFAEAGFIEGMRQLQEQQHGTSSHGHA